MRKNVSVVLSGFINSIGTKKVLLGYNAQTYRNFEIVLFLSTSDVESQSVIASLKKDLFYDIKLILIDETKLNVVKQLNDFLLLSDTDYVVFANANAIPRYDFVEQHFKYREQGYMLNGDVQILNKGFVDAIQMKDIYSGECFELNWVLKNKASLSLLDHVCFRVGLLPSVFNLVFKSKKGFNLDNSSIWKQDLLNAIQATFIQHEKADFEDVKECISKIELKTKQIKFSTLLIQSA